MFRSFLTTSFLVAQFASFGLKDFQRKEKLETFSIENVGISVMLPLKVSVERKRFVIRGKQNSAHWKKWEWKAHFEHFGYQDFEWRKTSVFPQNEWVPTSKNLSIDTLIEEMNHVVTKKNEFGYRDEAMLDALLRMVLLTKFWCKNQNEKLFIQIVQYN